MKVLLGMSGGLDSTYAAYLLKQQGHEVHGAVLQMHEYTETEDARAACETVGIDLTVIDCRERFVREVVEPFTDGYLAGQTPNPCIFCNPRIKFAALYEYAMQNGFDRIATGHYCRIEKIGDRYAVCRADDPKKDQSYVLWGLTQEQLRCFWTPLASMRKEDIRAQAMRLGFPAAQKKESQEICFIPDHDYAAFIENRRAPMPAGDFVDWNGKVVGRHRGILHYTVGQRKGLGIALGEPVFVSRIDPATNTVHLARAGGEYCTEMTVRDLQFQALAPQSEASFEAEVRVRYSSPMIPCRVHLQNGTASVTFLDKVRAVTPGQSAVFYRDNAVLFGGYIV